jgi:aryl-alcohol dehydrogenase-like predicted oxidoreductase
MQNVNIPKTDLYASPLVLGTDYFGSTVSRERSMQLMDHYLDAGGNVLDARVRALFDHQENRDRFQRLRRLQQKHGLSVGQVVLGYLTSQPFPVFPLAGPKTLADLQDCIRSAETKLSQNDLFYLEHGDAQNR